MTTHLAQHIQGRMSQRRMNKRNRLTRNPSQRSTSRHDLLLAPATAPPQTATRRSKAFGVNIPLSPNTLGGIAGWCRAASGMINERRLGGRRYGWK